MRWILGILLIFGLAISQEKQEEHIACKDEHSNQETKESFMQELNGQGCRNEIIEEKMPLTKNLEALKKFIN